MSEDPFDTLEKTKSSGGGDYATWWNNDNFDREEGDTLVGIAVEKHAYTDPGGNDHPVMTVICSERSTGDGLGEGVELATPTHSSLTDFVDECVIGDLVLIEYDGITKSNSGRDTNVYSFSRVPREKWESSDSAEDLTSLWHESSYYNGNGKSTDGGATATAQSSSDDDSSGLTKAVDFAEDVLDMNDGEVSLDELDNYLNEIRDYGVDTEEVVVVAEGIELDGDTVRKT